MSEQLFESRVRCRHRPRISNQRWFWNCLHVWLDSPGALSCTNPLCAELQASVRVQYPHARVPTVSTGDIGNRPLVSNALPLAKRSRGAAGTARNWQRSYAAPLASVFAPRTERQSVTVCLQACGCGQVRPTQIPVFLRKQCFQAFTLSSHCFLRDLTHAVCADVPPCLPSTQWHP